MSVQFNETRRVYEVVDPTGKVVMASKRKMDAEHFDIASGYSPAPKPALDAIVKGIGGALREFGYQVDDEYVGKQVTHVLLGEDDQLSGGPGLMAKSLMRDVEEQQPAVLAAAREELRRA